MIGKEKGCIEKKLQLDRNSFRKKRTRIEKKNTLENRGVNSERVIYNKKEENRKRIKKIREDQTSEQKQHEREKTRQRVRIIRANISPERKEYDAKRKDGIIEREKGQRRN